MAAFVCHMATKNILLTIHPHITASFLSRVQNID